jgi:hypothetical protein
MAWRVLRLQLDKTVSTYGGRGATSILNKQSLTAGGPPAWGLDGRVTTAHRKNAVRYDTFYLALEVLYILWSTEIHYRVQKVPFNSILVQNTSVTIVITSFFNSLKMNLV